MNIKDIKNNTEPTFIKLAAPIDNPIKNILNIESFLLLKICAKAKKSITRYSE